MVKISIIIPYYNAEEYIEECIRSVYNQDLPIDEYEVICVDDNPDNPTRVVVKELQKSYSTLRLLVLDKNVKQGGARNAGIKAAKGKYIWFVDADDYVYPNVLSIFCREMDEYDLDFLHFNYNLESNGIVQTPVRGQYPNKVVRGVDLFFNPNAQWWTEHIVVWQRIHKRQFLLDNNLWFAEHVFCEDDDFSYKTYAYAQKTKHIDVVGYCYRQAPSSAMHQQFKPIYAISLIKQAKRLSSDMHLLNKVDIRFNELIRSDMGCSFNRIIKQLECMGADNIKEVKNTLKISDFCGTWRVVPKKLLFSFFKVIYF